MPTINLPTAYPEQNDFDGFIYSAELPRDRYLDRMLAEIGFGTVRKNSTLESYEFFKKLCETVFRTFHLANKRKAVFDEVIHRIAFPVVMESPLLIFE